MKPNYSKRQAILHKIRYIMHVSVPLIWSVLEWIVIFIQLVKIWSWSATRSKIKTSCDFTFMHCFCCSLHLTVVLINLEVIIIMCKLLFQVLVGGTAQIIQPNITAENGFVHVIDKVRHKKLFRSFQSYDFFLYFVT